MVDTAGRELVATVVEREMRMQQCSYSCPLAADAGACWWVYSFLFFFLRTTLTLLLLTIVQLETEVLHAVRGVTE